MKTNYDSKLQNIINSLDSKKRLLLHSCCGPCSSYVIDYLKDYFDITVLYYNPNIEPESEYIKRKNEQVRLLNIFNIPFIDIDYDNNNYREFVKGHEKDHEGGARCHMCYELRLLKTMNIAIENKFDYFCTTLTVSPYKNAEVINEIGKRISQDKNILWLYSDFKKRDGYKKSIELSKKYDLYRQDYCGCLFSKKNEIEE